jgi:hypothetical protein
MKCVDCQDVLAEYALDTLEPGESNQVTAHLADGCVECQRYLDDVRGSWAAMADTLQPARPPSQVASDLFARLRAESNAPGVRIQHAFSSEAESVTLSRNDGDMQRSPRWQLVWPYVAATLIGIAVGFWYARSSGVDAELAGRYREQLQEAERTFGAPQMRFAALHVSENRPEIRGHLIWDGIAQQLHIYAFDMGTPPDGSGYRLSLVLEDGTWVRIGNLNVGPDGVCTAVFDLPRLDGRVSRVVVTTEPTDGADADGQAHGRVDLTGEFPMD